MPQTTFQQMYVADITSIAAAGSHTTDSTAMDVSDVEVVAVQVKSTGGNASISGNLVVKIVGSVDGTNFDTQIFATATLVQTTNSEERATALVNVRGLNSIKVTEIENEDASYTSTSVNVFIGKTIV
jgi:hypothetical protein